ncbi:MAG: Zn-dependent oxidoreductase [Ignavibacteria bacterium GWB2_35_6b]|nr:MAG: Zn-dependent oxidoreductase [Ignavibacteria bacterium GWB2_35_6b]
MKAVVYQKYGKPDVIELKEIEKPVPKENEVLIKVYATTITAVDSIFRNGNNFFARLATGITKPKKEILGFEFSGVLESVGKDVKLFKAGDQVFGVSESAHMEYISLPENNAFITKPSNLSFEEAAAVPSGALTALPFLRDNGKIESGKKILIIGASGSVGTYAVQFAKYYGAEITGVCSTVNSELVKSLGADFIIDYTKEDFTKSRKTYDIIFDTVGKSSYQVCKNSLNYNGIFLTTFISWAILFQMLLTSKSKNKKAAIAFTGMRSVEDKKKDLLFIKELIEYGKLKAVIDKTYKLEEAAKAHEYVDKGHKKGNVVLKITNNKSE